MKGTLLSLVSGTYKRIGFFGLGRSNKALISLLPKDTEIILRSDRDLPTSELSSGSIFRVFSGERALSQIDEDLLLLSPSVRRDKAELTEAIAQGTRVSSDGEMFFESVDVPVFAVTGSDGKSTTATLSAMLLRESFPDISLCGNIGVPMCPELMKGCSAYVTELSSFQLQYLSPKVQRAALTNLTPNHLNWHTDMTEYIEAKLSLTDSADKAIISVDSKESYLQAKARRLFGVTSGNIPFCELRSIFRADVYYTEENGHICRNGEPILDIREIGRREEHNIKNLLTALALTDGYASMEHIADVSKSFSGLAHRCQSIGIYDGKEYVNSSIDTTPARTAQTLRSLKRRVTVLLGGRGKGVGYEPLLSALREYADLAVLFGECRYELLEAIGDNVPTVVRENLREAVNAAVSMDASGTVLLSPSATSYDEFSSFEERGMLFKKLILRLKSK